MFSININKVTVCKIHSIVFLVKLSISVLCSFVRIFLRKFNAVLKIYIQA